MNEEKKFINSVKELNSKELKRFIQELELEYKRSKDELKKELISRPIATKEKEERLKMGKERIKGEQRLKEEKKRKQLDLTATEDLCLLQRKHLSMLHKREYELLSNVRLFIEFFFSAAIFYHSSFFIYFCSCSLL